MASEIWTSTPPSEDGYYWWRQDDSDEHPEIVEVGKAHSGKLMMWTHACERGWDLRGQFGPRIPSAAELHQHAEAMTANIVARAEAERRCRELEAERANLVQNLCHNLPESDYAAFCDGCDAYQRKLFGKCRSDTLREHPLPLFDIDVDSPEDSE